MSQITVEKNSRIFKKDGKYFFYLADTCWSAFTNITLEEWEYYLNLRKYQGFNVIQINILPQWDASGTDLNFYPLPYNGMESKTFEFTEFNQEYFNRARHMCKIAKEKGFELALVVLWCNYVPGTWASKIFGNNIMPYDFVDKYVEKVHETFSDLDPIYVISGDTDLDGEDIEKYYLKVANKLRKLAPDLLQTLHIKGRLDVIPKKFIDVMDFYMYQSGHNAQNPAMPYLLAETFYKKYPVKPIINSEPCYEQMGYSRNMYGRFYQFDVRRAAWMSLLSGACAGVTYGAHGIYSWHKIGKTFGLRLGEGFDSPNPWNDAVKYPGAWDYGYIKYLLDLYRIHELVPMYKIKNSSSDIRMASTKNEEKILIYVPVNTNVKIDKDLSRYDIKVIDLVNKNICIPNMEVQDGETTVYMHNFEQDVLIIAIS
ncbi:DUF4038 domain-containing protein [Clostridium sp. BL-8]|uniref:apiosidase-like domain-containing protein n=1 Tax=Clostridium sp. BL-8 TaxID=349938 RepID=UPI00098C1396|nr:DUF4038 domain-containing protein [Clostridium sp. BL-8]OOM77356.1 putative endoglucanase [Clostridium sp. BL-8]